MLSFVVGRDGRVSGGSVVLLGRVDAAEAVRIRAALDAQEWEPARLAGVRVPQRSHLVLHPGLDVIADLATTACAQAGAVAVRLHVREPASGVASTELTHLAHAFSRRLDRQARPAATDGTFVVVLDDAAEPHFFTWTRSLRERGASALGERLDRRWGCVIDDSTIVRLWRTVGADSTQLPALRFVTADVGGARPLRALLQTLAELERHVMLRLTALVALVPYLAPSDSCAGQMLDTLRSLPPGCSVDHPSYRSSSSIEPLFRDSIRARLREAAAEPGAVGRAAGWLTPEWRLPERWSDERADWCRRAAAAFGPALRMSVAVLRSDELPGLAECTESGPPALALAWRRVPADSAALDRLVELSAEVRDRRLYAALLAVARDAARPVAVRVAAVDAIAPLLHPALYWFTTATSEVNRSRTCSRWGFLAAHEAVQEEGGEPMGPASRRAGAAELGRLAAGDVPPQVAHAARTVARCAGQLLDTRPPEVW